MSQVATAKNEPRLRARVRGVLQFMPPSFGFTAGSAYGGTSGDPYIVGHRSAYLGGKDITVDVSSHGAGHSDDEPIATTLAISSESSTAPAPISGLYDYAQYQLNAQIESSVAGLFAIAKEERFEDGMDSNLRVGLVTLMRRYPGQTLTAIRAELRRPRVSLLVLAEALHTLGSIEHVVSIDDRLLLLISYLQHASPLVRDAAATGLSYLEDVRAIPFLVQAIESERNENLRDDLHAILDDLEAHGARAA